MDWRPRRVLGQLGIGRPTEEAEVGPLREVPAEDWDEQVRRANEVVRLVDRHLDGEARLRMLFYRRDFRPQHLCPEQRVQMVTDLYAATRG